jgi:hypothetical protein
MSTASSAASNRAHAAGGSCPSHPAIAVAAPRGTRKHTAIGTRRMRVKRLKTARRSLAFYRHHFGLRDPLQVLGTPRSRARGRRTGRADLCPQPRPPLPR